MATLDFTPVFRSSIGFDRVPKNDHEYLCRGIAARSFERVFDLANYIEVTSAMMGDGLLIIDLKRELPEALKPRRIEIAAAPVKLVRVPSQQAA